MLWDRNKGIPSIWQAPGQKMEEKVPKYLYLFKDLKLEIFLKI